MTSHNLSKAALGEIQTQKHLYGHTGPDIQLSVRNHEVRPQISL